jgi:putative flavoprotein involved in K+ transport
MLDEAQKARERELPGSIDTVVIGGGQAGLSAGYYLQSNDVPFVILDAHERVGDAWRKRWDSLRLFTIARISRLPGMPFPAPSTHYPSKDEMADYLEAYAAHFELPVRNGVMVDRLEKVGDRFVVHTGSHSIRAENVIVATGFDNRPNVPDFAGELNDDIYQLHSKDYRNPTQLDSGSVLVVGAGNSGAEIALEVAKAGHRTWLSGRDVGQEPSRAGSLPDKYITTPLIWFVATRVVTVDRSIGRKLRDDFLYPPKGVPRGRVFRSDLKAAGVEWLPRIEGVRDGVPYLDDGRTIEPQNVVWCTGFTPGYDWIDLPLSTNYGVPDHERGVVESLPGLYFLGLYFQYSLASPLVGGVGRDAHYVVEHLVSHRATRDEMSQSG